MGYPDISSYPIPHKFPVAEVEFVRGTRIESPLDPLDPFHDVLDGAAVAQAEVPLHSELLARDCDHAHFLEQELRQFHRILHVGAEVWKAVEGPVRLGDFHALER